MATKLTRATTAELRHMQSQTDLARVEADARESKPPILDADDTPLTAGELDRAARRREQRGQQKAPTKETINLRVDRLVVNAFRSMGRGWRTMMNAVLRQHVESQTPAAPTSDNAGRRAAKRAPGARKRKAGAKRRRKS